MDIRQVPGNVSAGSSSACLLPCRRLRSARMPARGKLRPGAPLAGALLLAWLVARRAGVAGALAGGAYLARPEGVLLLPLGLWRLRRARLRALVLYAGAAVAVMAPALIALRAETGHWQLSPREARVALLTGVPGATTLAEAALRDPAALLARMAGGVARQVLYDATALGPLCAIPFLLGVG